MATCLAGLHNLEVLSIGFRSPSPSDRTNPPPPTRVVLPTLNYFKFEGVCKYLEDFVARIDTPSLDSLDITVFGDPILDIPQFRQFICRMERLQPLNRAEVLFYGSDSSITLGSPTRHRKLELRTTCSILAWQVSAVSRVWDEYLLHLSKHVEQLRIKMDALESEADVGSTQWLEFLHPCPAVLPVSSCRAAATSGPRWLHRYRLCTAMQVLPALRSLHSEGFQPFGSVKEAIEPFVAMCQLAGHPVAIHRWQPELECDWEDVDKIDKNRNSTARVIHTLRTYSIPVYTNYVR